MNMTFDAEKDVMAALVKYPKLFNKLELAPFMFENSEYVEVLNYFKDAGGADIKTLYRDAQQDVVSIRPQEILELRDREMIYAGRFKQYQEDVLNKYKKLTLANAANDYLNGSIDNIILENVLKNTKELSLSNVSRKNEVINKIMEGLSKDNRTIHKTDIKNLDAKIEGFESGQLNILGARPSMGKTAFALQLAINYARNNNRVTFISLETDEVKVTRRILASMAGVRLDKFKTKDLMTIEEMDKVSDSAEEYLKMDFEVYDENNITPQKIRTIIGQNNEKQNIVLIDYIQLIKLGGFKDERTELNEISRQLKIIAKETGAIIIALAQLSRGVESRTNKRPMMSDLKESGGLEQDADIVMLLYRDDYYNEPKEKNTLGKSDVECIIAKNKDGSTGKVDTEFYKPTQRFY